MEPIPPPPPMTVPDLLENLINLINDFQRKNRTMIDYYIYPRPVPTEIAAYEPRLLIYRTRVQNLARLNATQLSALVDNGLPLILSYALPSIADLIAASTGIQRIFVEHYDRRLEQSLPYDTIYQALHLYHATASASMGQLMNNPRRQPAEQYAPIPTSQPSLCRGAISFTNNRDRGKCSSVAPSDVLSYHNHRLADKGGVVLWWECPECAFRLQYHASNSANLSINHTDDVVIEDDVDTIAYRSAWLVKCHIYHPRPAKPPAPSPPTSPKYERSEVVYQTRPVSPISPSSNSFNRPQAPPKRVSFSRRTSSGLSAHRIMTETHTARIFSSLPPGPSSPKLARHQSYDSRDPKSHASSSKTKSSKTKKRKDPTGPHGLIYYCPFCVANGKTMVGPPRTSSSSRSSSPASSDDGIHKNKSPNPTTEPTCFPDAHDLIEHIDDHHTRDRPVPLLLQAFKVAIKGELAPGPEKARGRWDLDLR